jgi:L-fucose isomerase-like protein
MEAAIGKEELKDDFSSLTMQLYDESELRQRQKEQMQGNMHLIVELFKNNLIKSNILINCFDELQQERSNQNVDILAQMLMKLSEFMMAKSKADR